MAVQGNASWLMGMEELQVAFRVDASLEMGTGHVMRCLTLAGTLKANGAMCRFICREHQANLLSLIRERGFEAIGLPAGSQPAQEYADTEDLPAHAAWLGTDWIIDANQTCTALGEVPVDWLIVDHYALDVQWERRMRPACRRLMVIDDLADRVHDCELLLDQNLGRMPVHYHSLVPSHCTVLVGPHYALLRSEFSLLRDYSLKRRATPRLGQILITMGGVDQPNATSQVLAALKHCLLPEDCRIVVVMGAHAPWLEAVKTAAITMPYYTDVRVNVDNMAQLMADSDLAIGAAGSTSWERCCLGLPTLMLVLADNQKEAATHLERSGATLALERGAELSIKLSASIERMRTNPENLRSMTCKAKAITDGAGCQHVARELLSEY
jgi:UDP-2,4-diacetamido-2,4,6-trideoxy-beta-L-altropyranose hydrolase